MEIERFMSYWKDDPLGLCNFTGRAIARLASRNFSDLFFAIGTSYFAYHCLSDRIDHLYEHHDARIGGIKGKTIKSMVDIDFDNGVICLHDKHGRHNNIELMLWRQDLEGHLTYFLRPVDGNEDFDFDDCVSWNFRRSPDATEGVTVYPEARGFYDLTESKNVADLIILASNLTGFVGHEC